MRGILLVPLALCLGCGVAVSTQFEVGSAKPAGDKVVEKTVPELIAELKDPQKNKVDAVVALGELKAKAAPAVPELIKLFHDKDEFLRLQVALALGKIGAPAVAPLTKAVADKDAGVRFYAVWALAFIGPDATSATAAVLKALDDESADVRRKAAYALGRIDPDPEQVAGPLAKALADKSEDVRHTAAGALAKLGAPGAEALLKTLKSNDSAIRNLAIKTLGEIGPDAKVALPELKALLLDPDKGSAGVAADALAGLGEPALPALVEAAKADSAEVRTLAVQALVKVGVPAVPHLVDLLGAKHVDVRRVAAAQLGFMQVQDKSLVIALGFALKDTDHQVKLNALNSLRNMGSSAKLAEKYVIEVLIDPDPQIRQNAFYTLEKLGVDPRPGLKKALSHKDPVVRIATASLMLDMNLEPDLAEPILRDALKLEDAALKTQAAYTLAKKGLQADDVLPLFLAGLKNEKAAVRRQSAEAIALYGAKASKAAPALIAALDDTDDSVRAQALATLSKVGAEPKALLPALVKVLEHKDISLHKPATKLFTQIGPGAIPDVIALFKGADSSAVRLACVQTLSMVGPPAKEAVPELIKALADKSARVRLLAARALGNIGPDAKAALPALTKAEDDNDTNVRQLAKAALAQIQAAKDQKFFEVQGVLTADDPFDPVRGGCYQVVHVYFMKAGQTYTIDLKSTWDNFLRLENSQGQQLAQDDDSGGFPNARIIFKAPADGPYRIIVTSFGSGATGSYTLTVK
jgi:HEAT repeat protein